VASLRNTTNPDVEAVVLDAAREHLLAVGWRRATLTDIARTAGVSRMTIYRRWPDMHSLVGDLMAREWVRVGEAAGVSAEGGSEGSVAERIGRAMVAAARGLRSNDVFRRIMEVDPEVLLTYLVDRKGRSQERLLDLLEPVLAAGQREGSVRAGIPPRRLAATILLATHGFAISAGTMADVASEDELAEDLRSLLTGYLTP
jgi:AcrR family transcriptional regulator